MQYLDMLPPIFLFLSAFFPCMQTQVTLITHKLFLPVYTYTSSSSYTQMVIRMQYHVLDMLPPIILLLSAYFPCMQTQVTLITHKRNVSISYEKLLTRHLLDTYAIAGRGGRPVINMSHTTVVEFGLGLIQMDLDEKENVLITSVWTTMIWHDEYLTWDPEEFGDIRVVRLEADHVWLPDITLFNTADPKTDERSVLVTVYFDGSISWVPQQVHRSSCAIDVTQFPFDNQMCNIWFGSWTHSKDELNLTLRVPGGIDLSTFQSDYKQGCKWDITETKGELGEAEGGFLLLQIQLHLRRKFVFSSYMLTLPCIFLAFLTIVVFCLPPERPDRTVLAMNLFSSFLVLLLILVEAAPPTASSVPKLGLYYCFNMIIIMLSVFLSSLVVNINKRGGCKQKPPRWLHLILIRGLGPLLFVHIESPCHKGKQRLLLRKLSDLPEESQLSSSQCLSQSSLPDIAPGSLEHSMLMIKQHVHSVHNYMRKLLLDQERKQKECKQHKVVVQQWRAIGTVIDRLFVLMYLMGIILSLWIIFPVPPWKFLLGQWDQ